MERPRIDPGASRFHTPLAPAGNRSWESVYRNVFGLIAFTQDACKSTGDFLYSDSSSGGGVKLPTHLVFRVCCLLILLNGIGLSPAFADDDDDIAPIEQVAVTAQRLDVARSDVQKSLGATSYTLTNDAVESRPSGETTTLDQILLQMPGVTEDGFGNLHVRGSTSELEYRLNGVALPEGLTDLGDMLSARTADNVELVTGALPAEFGLRTAGVVNITTKSGAYLDGGEAELYGGSNSELEPAIEYGRSFDNLDIFATGEYFQSAAGLAPPDNTGSPRHDHTQKWQGLAVGNYTPSDDERLSLVLGASQNRFDIPNARDENAQTATGPGGFQRPLIVNGISAFASGQLDRHQDISTQFAVLSYLRTFGEATLQLSGFGQISRSAYRPDRMGELLFNGLSQHIDNRKTAYGVQGDIEYPLEQNHTLRSGILATSTGDTFNTETWSLPIDGAGQQLSQIPFSSSARSKESDFEFSAYVQDEWKVAPSLTVNYGLRFDRAHVTRAESAVSPRINAVWEPQAGTTIHAGYAKLFTPPTQVDQTGLLSRLPGTTAMLPTTGGNPPRAETDDYFDIGWQRKMDDLTIGLDAYLSSARNLLAQRQVGSALFWSAYNFARGQREGLELSATYAEGPLSLWGNLSLARVAGKDIVSSQYYFTSAQLSALSARSAPLDASQTLTGVSGASYRFGNLRLSASLVFGSGYRRTLGGALPNSSTLPAHTQSNITAIYHVTSGDDKMFDLRLDVLNAFDNRYAILDGTALGAGPPQWSMGRAVYVGIEKAI